MCRSIEAQPTCVAFANRAMAHLKAGNAAAAEEDCSAALQRDATYLKAWQRRSSARRALGRQLDAIDDLEQALRCSLPRVTMPGVLELWAYHGCCCLGILSKRWEA